ncbi:MAG: uracil-DNA glycosylase [Planctomycetaceae bacterium]|nr:uracil-DNA glycosylase [Planctomycetaceae bacterium]
MLTNPQRALRQKLSDWQRAGVTHVPHLEPSAPVSVPRKMEAQTPETPPTAPVTASPPPSPPPKPSKSVASPELPVSPSKLTLTQREQELSTLAQTVAKCTRCQELASTRTQTVFGVGNAKAQVMFIGEAPGADEDKQGEPFVGRAGQLMNKIIEACGWQRSDLYICNILRCRPPGNRNPTPEEAGNCREYLDGQIGIVDPEYIVCWGSVAAHNLLDETTSIGKLRQKWFKYGRAKVLCTYHPSYLLRNPAAKKPVWEDMKFLLAEMGLEPPSA